MSSGIFEKITFKKITKWENEITGMTIQRHSRYSYAFASRGDNRARTCDPMRVMHVLSQLSYASVTYCIT